MGGACGWSVVQVDHGEEMRPMLGMYGTLDAELEVRRTIKRAELTAFLCLLRKAIGPTTVHVDDKGNYSRAVERRKEVHWRKSEGCPLVDLDLERNNCKEYITKAYWWRSSTSKRIVPRRKYSNCRFRKFITDGNAKADEVAREGGRGDGGVMAQIRTSSDQQRREEVHTEFQYAASFRCLVEEWQDCEELKPKLKEKCSSVD